MNSQFVKQLGFTFLTLAFVGMMFSSCHRKSGCPNKITQYEMPQQQELLFDDAIQDQDS